MIYIIAIAFTLFATQERVVTDVGNEELDRWFGSLTRSILSLYEAILGGADWNDEIVPLIDIHWVLGLMFMAYIAFAILAMLNVVTGIFVESALANAKKETDRTFESHVK